MFSAALFLPLLLSQTHPCADSSLYSLDPNFWGDASWEDASGDLCDTEESLLFSKPAERPRVTRQSNRASFSMTRNSGAEVQSTLRQQAEREGWSHRLEIRDDTLTRRRISKEGNGWRWTAGDLDDPELPIWPEGLPRRTLPRGWRRSAGPRDAGYGLSAPLSSKTPQGFAAGVIQPRWKAWTARAWNPVETGGEPSWSPAWSLRHASTGISISLPWMVSTQFTETRVTRQAIDSIAEQQWAASVVSPGETFLLVGAMEKTRESKKSGWALATAWHHRFENAYTVDFTARQRDDAWASSWDPAVTERAATDEDSSDRNWGAGEFRVSGHVPISSAFLEQGTRASVDAETWRAWNPAVGTGREGVRGRLDWHADDVRVRLTGTRRSARAASGSVSLYRYLEVETRLEENPRFPEFPEFSLAAFRAWNGSGPTRTGIFMGVEPTWKDVRANSGVRIETNADDDLSARGSLGAQWTFARGWKLEANAAAPCYPHWVADEVRWRVTVNYGITGSIRHPRVGGDPDSDK